LATQPAQRTQLTEKRVATRCWCHTPAHETESPGLAVNGDEVRNIKFRRGHRQYYDASQVNEVLYRIAAELMLDGLPGR